MQTPLRFKTSIAQRTVEAGEKFLLTPFLFINIAREQKNKSFIFINIEREAKNGHFSTICFQQHRETILHICTFFIFAPSPRVKRLTGLFTMT